MSTRENADLHELIDCLLITLKTHMTEEQGQQIVEITNAVQSQFLDGKPAIVGMGLIFTLLSVIQKEVQKHLEFMSLDPISRFMQ